MPPYACLGSRYSLRTLSPANRGKRLSSRTKIGEEHHHDERIQRRFHESVVLVEVLGILILGVNQHHPDANGLSYFDGLEHEVFQEGRTKTLALVLESTPIRARSIAGISSG